MRQQQIDASDAPESTDIVVRNVFSFSAISDVDVVIVSDYPWGTDDATAAWPTYVWDRILVEKSDMCQH